MILNSALKHNLVFFKHHKNGPKVPLKSRNSRLTSRHGIGTIARSRKLRCPIRIPSERLSPNRPCVPPIERIFHAVINDPILCSVWTCCETCVTDSVGLGIAAASADLIPNCISSRIFFLEYLTFSKAFWLKTQPSLFFFQSCTFIGSSPTNSNNPKQ